MGRVGTTPSPLHGTVASTGTTPHGILSGVLPPCSGLVLQHSTKGIRKQASFLHAIFAVREAGAAAVLTHESIPITPTQAILHPWHGQMHRHVTLKYATLSMRARQATLTRSCSVPLPLLHKVPLGGGVGPRRWWRCHGWRNGPSRPLFSFSIRHTRVGEGPLVGTLRKRVALPVPFPAFLLAIARLGAHDGGKGKSTHHFLSPTIAVRRSGGRVREGEDADRAMRKTMEVIALLPVLRGRRGGGRKGRG